MHRLPPFDALLAFEAALRHGSMTAAASELGITQSAVSHRLRRLEAFIGQPLLQRLNRGLAPTPQGQALADGFAPVLAQLAALRGASRNAARPERLRVGVGAALAQHWLLRRLPAFARRHPDIAVEIVQLTSPGQARDPDLDLRVLWLEAEDARSSSTQRPLFREQIFPVCHPALLPRRRMLHDPKALASLPLLHKGSDEKPGEAAEWQWKTWFTRLGIEAKPKAMLRFGDVGLAVSGALEGAGAVLGRSLLVRDALAERRLVRVLPPVWDMPSRKVQAASWPAALSGDSRIKTFLAWLAAEAEDSASAVAA